MITIQVWLILLFFTPKTHWLNVCMFFSLQSWNCVRRSAVCWVTLTSAGCHLRRLRITVWTCTSLEKRAGLRSSRRTSSQSTHLRRAFLPLERTTRRNAAVHCCQKWTTSSNVSCQLLTLRLMSSKDVLALPLPPSAWRSERASCREKRHLQAPPTHRALLYGRPILTFKILGVPWRADTARPITRHHRHI